MLERLSPVGLQPISNFWRGKKMEDKFFGELQYEYGWVGEMTINWYGEDVAVNLVISGEEDEEIDALQYDSYAKFMEKWSTIQTNLLDRILQYYQNLRRELGYDDDSNEAYPCISSTVEIKNRIGLDIISLPSSGVYNGRSIALAFHCDWDVENGLGILFVNEEISEIGFQDIAF